MNALERVPKTKGPRLQQGLQKVWDEPKTHWEAREKLAMPAEWVEVEGEETLS